MSGLGLTPDQRETALAIFRTIRSLAPEPIGEPEPPGGETPIRSDEDIDPKECNWVHNITACEGDPDPNQRDDSGICCKPLVDGEIEPGNANGGSYPTPTAGKECGPEASVAITSDGQVSCLRTGNDAGMANDEPGGLVVDPQRPVTIIDGMDPNECNWIHNINACFSDGQVPADITMDEYDEYMAVLWLAREDLSQRLAVEIGSIELAEIERAGWPVYWPEEPEPGVAYIDIALPGFRMVLEADGQTYKYETDTSERVVFVG